jgi:hypothetical protein
MQVSIDIIPSIDNIRHIAGCSSMVYAEPRDVMVSGALFSYAH